MTVLLLNCLNVLCQNLNDNIPLRGKSDSVTFIINSNEIRSANAKMLERKMLLEITSEQDSIISFKDSYIFEQEKIIKDFQNKLNMSNNINTELYKNIEKQKKITYVVGGVAGATLLTTIVLILVK